MTEIKRFDCHFDLKSIKGPGEGDPNIGKFEGFASTFGNVDRVDDVIVKGAFENTLKDHANRDRQIRMLFQHDRWQLIGGFPIKDAREDDKGLFVKGDVNLDTQVGREAFSLMKQGVLEDMSIGFRILDSEMDNGIQRIKDVELFEISLVTEPANQEAQVTSVKSVVPYQDLPLASANQAWDGASALASAKEFSEGEEAKSSDFESSFLWHLKGDEEVYKLQIAVPVDGKLKAVPRALFSAAASLQASCGDAASIPASARPTVIKNLEMYYEKMGRESPFEKGFSPDELKTLSRGDLVKFLRAQPPLSKAGAEYLAQGIMGGSGDQVAEQQADGLRQLGNTLTSILKRE